MKVLVLGANGMLGSAVMQILRKKKNWEVFGTVRSNNKECLLPPNIQENIIYNVDVLHFERLLKIFSNHKPDILINCIGLVKQNCQVNDPLMSIAINSLLPHRLASICEAFRTRMVHISTDCVFNGEKGNYQEHDPSDARDIYGKTKYLGELDYQHTITLRTSIIGHELKSTRSLVEWFLSIKSSCVGYTNAIFSGLPTVVLAEVIRDIIIPQTILSGVYHIGSKPISKFDLLQIIASVYKKKVEIFPDRSFVVNRSLNTDRFHDATGYVSPDWVSLIKTMYCSKKG